MTTESEQSPIRRRRWPWVVAAGLALAYLLAGFVFVPWYAKRELPRLVDEKLHHRARIGEFAFNPLTLTFRATDFALEDKAGRPVFGFSAATVDLEWRSLARRAWVFSEVRLVNPSAQLVIARDGRLNLAALAPGGGTPAGEPARFAIGRFVLENGRLDFEDQRGGYRNRLERLSLDLSSLSTLDSEKGPYMLVGQTPGGATLRWKGELSLAPLAASGTLAIANVALAELAPYFDQVAAARIVSGRAGVELPYRFVFPGGKPHLTVSGAKLEVREFELAGKADKAALLKIRSLALEDVNYDSTTHRASAAMLRTAGVALAMKRDANGELDLARVFAGKPGAAARAGEEVKPLGWQASIGAAELGDSTVSYFDATAKTPLALVASGLASKLKLAVESGADGVRVRVDADEITLARLDAGPAAAAGTAPPLRFAALSAAAVHYDSDPNTLEADSLRIGTLGAEAALRDGRVSLLDLATGAGKGKPGKPGRPFSMRVKAVELADGSATVTDGASGVALVLERIAAKFSDATTDEAKPLAFTLSAGVKSGGRVALRGRAVAGTLDAKLEATGLSLAPLQPFVAARYAAARLVSGAASFAGTLRTGGKDARLVYSGAASAANVALDDATGVRVLGWKTLTTNSLRLTFAPDRLEVDELRWIAPSGKFAIATDGSSNLSRAFAKKDAPPAPAAPSAEKDAGEEDFAVAVRRVRLEQGALDFSDDSLSPGFVAKIYDLAGTANGLSSDRSTRSQFDFEGRVDEFGYARLSGAINLFVPRERTAFRVQLRNIDLATVSPYSVPFAGYRLASGHMSLDLNYRVRGSIIEGDNKITLEKITLGERIESATALKFPLELAIALLKDENGTITMELPVTGNLDDPQFSFAPIIWKAVGNFLGGIISAPFRALGRLFGGGGSGDEGGAIAFDPGASRLLPPEREKIGRIVEMLAKRPELKLVIPARYDAEADAHALKHAALGRDIGRRAGFAVANTEEPGPVNTEDRSTRAALRAGFGERFSAAELDKLKTEAEAKARAAGAAAPSAIDQVRNFATGEPQITDAREFYQTLLRRLRDAQPLPPDALAELARNRGTAIEGALLAAGADPARIAQTAAQPTSNAEAKQVTVQLSLSLR
jgi:hypothetical protein